MSEEKEEKTCWACKRKFTGKSVMGLCPDCVNKFGTTVAGLGIVVFGLIGKNIKKK